jgi:hypothetical protein
MKSGNLQLVIVFYAITIYHHLKTKNMTTLALIQPNDPNQGTLPYHRKFDMVSEFVSCMTNVLSISDHLDFGSAYVWYHTIRSILANAFIDYPAPGIKYENVLVSRGNLWNTQEGIAKADDSGIIFTWSNDSGIRGAQKDDRCILVAYCEALSQCVFTCEGNSRGSGEAQLLVPDFRTQKVHTWLGFISADGKRIANSIYTGEIIVT